MHVWFLGMYFHGILCSNVCFCSYICFLRFSLALFLVLVLSYSSLFDHYIISLSIILDACLSS